jgi:hypothetical protein
MGNDPLHTNVSDGLAKMHEAAESIAERQKKEERKVNEGGGVTISLYWEIIR